MKRVFVGAMLVLASELPAHAVLYTGGAGFLIPDNTIAGASSTINAFNTDNIISSFDSVEIDTVGHTWVGDLNATITSPTGTSVQLFRRPGSVGPNVGNSGNWYPAGTLVFVLSGGATIPTNGNCGPGTYNINANPATTRIDGPPFNPNTYTAFIGENLNGNWTLNIADGAALDTGSISAWRMNITSLAAAVGAPRWTLRRAGSLSRRCWPAWA